jgi:hypothetical protein
MSNDLKQLSTYINEQDDLYQAVQAEAKDRAVSVSTVIRWALMERYKRQLEQGRQLQPDEVPAMA